MIAFINNNVKDAFFLNKYEGGEEKSIYANMFEEESISIRKRSTNLFPCVLFFFFF